MHIKFLCSTAHDEHLIDMTNIQTHQNMACHPFESCFLKIIQVVNHVSLMSCNDIKADIISSGQYLFLCTVCLFDQQSARKSS